MLITASDAVRTEHQPQAGKRNCCLRRCACEL